MITLTVTVLVIGRLVYIESAIVQSSAGKVQGEWSKEDDVTRFLGVPYASPPVGNLRFAPPKDMDSWNGMLVCVTNRPACPHDTNVIKGIQTEYKKTWNISFDLPKFDEDCLYLNVYVPGEVNTNNTLPVMVHFQDGGFQIGLVNVYDGSQLARTGNVIVVTFAARLGALGFYGKQNFGLQDQLHVLKWVQKNIANFGGDADRVTIFGSGSGGFSVGVHVKSAESRGLFKRAISQGSSIADINFFNAMPEAITKTFSEAVRCKQSDMGLQMKCLRSLTVDQILSAQANLSMQGHVFRPTIDGHIIPTSLDKLWIQRPNDVEYMLGVNSNGGTAGVHDFFDRLQTGATEEHFQSFLNGVAAVGFPSNPNVAREAIAYEYTPSGDKTDNMDLFKAILHLMRDAYASQVRGAQLMHAAFGFDVYAYYFDEAVPVLDGSSAADLIGVPAGSEELFLFGAVGGAFGQRMMKSWTSFAETG